MLVLGPKCFFPWSHICKSNIGLLFDRKNNLSLLKIFLHVYEPWNFSTSLCRLTYLHLHRKTTLLWWVEGKGKERRAEPALGRWPAGYEQKKDKSKWTVGPLHGRQQRI